MIALPDWRDPPTRRRAITLTLTLAIEAILLFLLLREIVEPPVERVTSEPTTFSLTPISKAEKAATDAAKPRAPVKAEVKPPVAPVIQPVIDAPPVPLTPYVKLSKEDFAVGDISKLASARGSGAGAGRGGGKSYGPGEGPGGAPLYNAEWVREPTDGELALYLPENRQPGTWGMIACQTIPNNRVENCRTMGESPGSRLGSALRQASWQFLVRPPREGDKPLIGVWVRIRFDIRDKGAG